MSLHNLQSSALTLLSSDFVVHFFSKSAIWLSSGDSLNCFQSNIFFSDSVSLRINPKYIKVENKPIHITSTRIELSFPGSYWSVLSTLWFWAGDLEYAIGCSLSCCLLSGYVSMFSFCDVDKYLMLLQKVDAAKWFLLQSFKCDDWLQEDGR